MRKPLVVANWKMNTSLADATILATSVKNAVEGLDVDIVLCPPFVWLYPVWEILEKSPKNLYLGAQNMWFTSTGAMTGEISPSMVKKMADFVILGHSERRQNLHETNELINDKVIAALEHDLTPIICVGEVKKQGLARRAGRPTRLETNSDIAKQLRLALNGLSSRDAEKIVIAYEPVWAISTSGTGESATGAYATEMIGRLRDVLAQKYNRPLAERIKILYGGSVDEDNIKEFIYQPEIDGVLMGGTSLRVNEFIKVCREAAGRE